MLSASQSLQQVATAARVEAERQRQKDASSAVERIRRAGGRPVKTERYDILIKAQRLGLSVSDAAKAAGINPEALHKWLKRHPEIRPELEAQKARGKLSALEAIERAWQDPRFWTAAMTWLERTYPNEYSQRQRIDLQSVTVSLDAYLIEMGHDPATLSAEQRRAIVSTVIGELSAPTGQQ